MPTEPPIPGRLDPGTELHLFGAFDEGYAAPAAVSLLSVARSLDGATRAVVHLVPFGLAPATRDKLESLVAGRLEIRWTEFDRDLLGRLPTEALPRESYLNKTVYIRLFIDRILPPEVRRVLLLDVDLIVRADLGELWTTPLDGLVAAAVRDVGCPTLASPWAVGPWARLGLDGRAPYFNAGVVLVDRDEWRAQEVERRSLDYLRQHGATVKLYDQEALNATLAGRWRELSPRWNAQIAELHQALADEEERIFSVVARSDVTEPMAAPAIAHFSGKRKPWTVDGIDLPWADEWWMLLGETPWADSQVRPAFQRSRADAVRKAVGRVRRAAGVLRHG